MIQEGRGPLTGDALGTHPTLVRSGKKIAGEHIRIVRLGERLFFSNPRPPGRLAGGFQLKGNRLLSRGWVCVPTPLQERVIYDHHGFLGHVGFQRLWDHIKIK